MKWRCVIQEDGSVVTDLEVVIRVRYESIDHFSKTRRFKTLKGAQKFAQHWVGETPEMGSFYAVSGDGIGKITCEGCRLLDLFPRCSP